MCPIFYTRCDVKIQAPQQPALTHTNRHHTETLSTQVPGSILRPGFLTWEVSLHPSGYDPSLPPAGDERAWLQACALALPPSLDCLKKETPLLLSLLCLGLNAPWSSVISVCLSMALAFLLSPLLSPTPSQASLLSQSPLKPPHRGVSQ